LTEIHEARVLHVIDQYATTAGFKPGELTVSLHAEHLGNLNSVPP
jgi:hypothetical protein